jgi:hypothetical protein
MTKRKQRDGNARGNSLGSDSTEARSPRSKKPLTPLGLPEGIFSDKPEYQGPGATAKPSDLQPGWVAKLFEEQFITLNNINDDIR